MKCTPLTPFTSAWTPRLPYVSPGVVIGDITVIGIEFGIAYQRSDRKGQLRLAVCECKCGCIHVRDTYKLTTNPQPKCMHNSVALRRRSLRDVWRHMNLRCFDESDKSYGRYGGRGITVFSEWVDSFYAFYEWALTSGHHLGLQIDRIDNDGPYAPWNCRWVTPLINTTNTRRTVYLTAFGETKPMRLWANDERCKVSYHVMRYRRQHGWKNDADIITCPIRKHVSIPLNVPAKGGV